MIGIITYHENGKWKNKLEGNKTATSTFDTKEEAIADGREEAKKFHTNHMIENLEGKVTEQHSYGENS